MTVKKLIKYLDTLSGDFQVLIFCEKDNHAYPIHTRKDIDIDRTNKFIIFDGQYERSGPF